MWTQVLQVVHRPNFEVSLNVCFVRYNFDLVNLATKMTRHNGLLFDFHSLKLNCWKRETKLYRPILPEEDCLVKDLRSALSSTNWCHATAVQSCAVTTVDNNSISWARNSFTCLKPILVDLSTKNVGNNRFRKERATFRLTAYTAFLESGKLCRFIQR